MPKIIGEPIPDYVALQINQRQAVHGKTHNRTAEDISYLNSKTAWVKLASGVALTADRIKYENFETADHPIPYDTLARQNILFGGMAYKNGESLSQRGTSSTKNNITDFYEGVYNVNIDKNTSKYGLAPMPGIISADIQCLNRGSIKKATVKIKCYTPEQFHILDVLYMRIGYTMLLEWGFSKYLDNSGNLVNMGYTLTEADKGFFAQNDYYTMLSHIESHRNGKCGNYDGLISKVVNFNWSFAQDGSYDITLELISVGDVIESLKCNVVPPYEMIQFIKQSYTAYTGETSGDEEQDNQQDNPSNNILSSYLFLQKLYLDEMGVDIESSRDVTLKYSGGQVDLGAVKITPSPNGLLLSEYVSSLSQNNGKLFSSESEAKTWAATYYPGSTQISNTSPYTANLQYRLADAGGGYYVNIRVDLNSQDIEITPQGKHTNVVYFNYNNGEQEQSSDLGFYMRLGHLLNFIQEKVIPQNTTTNQPLIKINTFTGTNKMYTMPYQVSLDPRVCIVNGRELVNTKDFYSELDEWKVKGQDYTAYIMNIYVNHNHINQLVSSNLDEKGNFNLFSFLESLCTDLNKALGNINHLEPVIDEDEHTITIIDQSYSPKHQGDKYGLELYGYNPKFNSSNFVRNISLKTEITPEFATMATIGSTAGGYVKGTENTMFSKWNKGIIDRYKEKFTSGGQTPEQMEEDVRKTYLEEFWKQRSAAFGLKGDGDGNWTLDDNIIEKNLTNVTEFYKLVYAKMQVENNKYSSPSNGFIPISLGVTMDGLSGFKIYNSLKVSTKFLPENYGDNLHFIIKGVNHKLSNNDWETTLETVVIAKNDING